MKLNHIGIAVKSIEERLKIWRDIFGFRVEVIEEVPEQKVRVAILESGALTIELLEPVATDSTIHRFIDRKGEGLHHLSFEVDDIEQKIEEYKKKNVKMIDDVPRKGAHGFRIAFIHPTSTGSVLIEISQKEEKN
jgi:methylmalonyl-CoA/ethylmalonyl-CoA epimerase